MGVLLGFVLVTGVGSLATLYAYFHQATVLHYGEVKAHYVAESGFAVAQADLDTIPIVAFPKTQLKPWIYAHLSLFYRPQLPMDGEIYLARSPDTLYTVGLVTARYREILKRTYVVQNGKVIYTAWSRM